jgi:hypothetical protein
MKNLAFILIPILLFGTVLDVGTTDIIFPKGRVRTRNQFPFQLHPKTIVKNFGDTTVTFPVIFKIDSVSVDTQVVENLTPNLSDTVNFSCVVPQFGDYSVACSTCLQGDIHPENDKCTDSFNIRFRDLYVTTIICPSLYVPLGAVVTPQLEIMNFGNITDSCPVILHIKRMFVIDTFLVYADTKNVVLQSGASTIVTFSSWVAETVGWYRWWLRIDTIRILVDTTMIIDSVSGSFYVYSSGIEEESKLTLKQGDIKRVEVYNITGKLISVSSSFDLEKRRNLPSGIYFIKYIGKEFEKTEKFVQIK